MAEENILLEALACSDFKVSIHDKNRVDALESKTVDGIRKQYGEEPYAVAASNKRNNDTKSLLATVKSMSASQRENVIELLKQNGLGDPLTKEKLVQNSFTVEKMIRDHASN